MDLDLRLQRALDRVELVSGTIGNPGDGRMCLMSLVAFLAGEEHTDAPGCASPLIQAFAVRINDSMPYEVRQRLKPFAPRIIGTNDGLDGVRAEVLCQILAVGALAEVQDHSLNEPTALAGGWRPMLWRLWRWLRKDAHQRLLACAMSIDDGISTADYAARLIVRLARNAPDTRAREDTWNAAIGILDKLCDVGAPVRREPGMRSERIAQLVDAPDLRQDTSVWGGKLYFRCPCFIDGAYSESGTAQESRRGSNQGNT
jgi:hypothetical protein